MSRATASKWLGCYRQHGQAGLADRSSRPHRCPYALPASQVRRVLAARRRRRQGPHRLGYHLAMPRSTVYGVLRRHHMSRLAHTDRPSGAVVRYERERPGELVHLDVKKLGRIPDGGGHRVHGRAKATRGRGIGYDYLHSAVDDRSRVAFSQILEDETGATAARFLIQAAGFFAEHGVNIQRVLTDNAKAYTDSVVFADTAAGLGIRRKRTRPYRPQTNGKSSDSTAPCWRSGPTPGSIAPTPSDAGPSPDGCGPTITTDHIPRFTASRRWRSSSTTLTETQLAPGAEPELRGNSDRDDARHRLPGTPGPHGSPPPAGYPLAGAHRDAIMSGPRGNLRSRKPG